MSDMFHVPTEAEWEARVRALRELLYEARAHLRICRKAATRRIEGPLLPGMDQPPVGSGSLFPGDGE